MREHAALAAASIDRRRIRKSGLVKVRIGAAVIAATALAAMVATGLTIAGYVLPVADSATPVDALVVLGGFGVPRAERAARLFADGVAPLVVVTGAGDCDAMRDTLLADGVPPAAIKTECASRSTQENATETAAILRARGVRSATLVTHWFHSRRAIATFRATAPEIRFSSAAVRPAGAPWWRLGWMAESQAVLTEYLKIAWYALRHGVVIRVAPEPATAGAGG